MGERLRRLPIAEYGPLAYIWLIYTAGVPIALVVTRAPAPVVSLQLALLAASIAVYVLGYGRHGRSALAYAGAMATIGAIAIPSDPAACTYFVYAAVFVAWGVSSALAYRIIGPFVALIALEAWLLQITPYAAVPAVVFSAVTGVLSIAGAEQRRSTMRLRLANVEIERLAKVAERERIARDLHDVLGHSLSLITLKSQLASQLAERDPDRAVAEIRDVERIGRASLDELRAAVAGYRCKGVAAELEHARNVLVTAGLRVECDADDVRLPPSYENVLGLAIRESVTNVVRHARATVVRLRLTCGDSMLRFEIHDDGAGASVAEGFGLTGMRERVESHGGSLVRNTEGGTHLVVMLPLST